MANKVTQEDILQFNTLYLELRTYAAVARKTGFSAGTVKKYIIPDFTPVSETVPCKTELREAGTFAIDNRPLSEDEWKEIEDLRKEIAI